MRTIVDKGKMNDERLGDAVGCALCESRGEDLRTFNESDAEDLQLVLPKNSRFLFKMKSQQVESAYGEVPKGELLSYQLR